MEPSPLEHVGTAELEAGLAGIVDSPADVGRVELIVRRPAVDDREVVEEATLDTVEGLVGDTWRARGNRRTPDGAADPEKQITLMNFRVVALLAPQPDRRPLPGDQLYVDFDLSMTNLPPGTHLAVGDAVVEVTEPPHTGCAKFSQRFGAEALRFVNSDVGRALRLRGMNAKVVGGGGVRRGDAVRKLVRRDGATTPT